MNITARKTTTFALVALALWLVLLLSVFTISRHAGAAQDPITDPGQASGDGVAPVLIQDNPTCSSLGNYRSLKVDPPNAGTYSSADGYLSATVSNIRDEGLGQIFDWSSTKRIDKVIVKGGDAADAYVYSPEDNGDTKLHAPVNPNNANNTYFDISHIDFCYDVEPQVSKTANTSFTRTFGWTIDKSVTPTELNLATGESGDANYTVAVTKDNGTDSDWAVSGKITVTNPLNNESLNISAIEDVVSQGTTNTTANVANCTSNNNPISFPYSLAANASLECSYSTGLGSSTNGTNTATAKASGTGITNGVGTANVTFGDPTTVVNDSITVSDSLKGSLGTFSASGSMPYTTTIGPYNTCGDRTITNTASISPASAASGPSSDSATVTAHVKCKLTVTKKLDPASDGGQFNLLIDDANGTNVATAANVGNNGTTGAQLVAPGSYTIRETAGTGTNLSDYVSKINCGAGDVNNTSTTVTVNTDTSCTITNTKKGSVTVKKTTDKVVNPSKDIKFALYAGSSPAGTKVNELSTYGDQDGVLNFGSALVPGSQYTVCENPVPAGFTSFWTLDGTIVTPFNPNATDSPPQDLGVRCYTFSANAGQALAFEVDNSHPGGEPRTIGYWKNWNKCTSGNQSATAAKNGGSAAGFFIVEDLLAQSIGNFNVTTCQQAVKVLSKQDQSGTNRASDAAYALASQLLAADFNLAAGAETCSAVQQAKVDAQNFLVSINFTGSGSYLTKSSKNQTTALNFASTLDKYNNGNLC